VREEVREEAVATRDGLSLLEYCEEHYDVEDKDTRDVFFSLIQIYFEPPEGIPFASARDVTSSAPPRAPFHVTLLAFSWQGTLWLFLTTFLEGRNSAVHAVLGGACLVVFAGTCHRSLAVGFALFRRGVAVAPTGRVRTDPVWARTFGRGGQINTVNYPANPPTNQQLRTNQPTNQPAEHPTNQPTNQPTNPPTNTRRTLTGGAPRAEAALRADRPVAGD
jgi:hypothetical protein